MAHLREETVFTGLTESNRGLTSGLKTLRSVPGGLKSPEALAGGVETPRSSDLRSGGCEGGRPCFRSSETTV
eukprot:5405700-Pyramimonas_sp.AAC.1